MAVGLQALVRVALMERLKSDSAVTDLVPVGQINEDDNSTWPLIKLRAPVTQRLRATCVNGGLVTWDLHVFAGPRKEGTSIADRAEDHAGAIGAAVETCLADNHLTLENGADARISLSDIRLLEDGDIDLYHWFCQVNCRVLAA